MKRRGIPVIISILILILMFAVWKIAFNFGSLTASLTIRQASPALLAKLMQSDNFYGTYPKTMLLVTGKVKSVSIENGNKLVEFSTANGPSVLPIVTCNIGKNIASVSAGQTISVLSVAHDAQRQNVADIYMPSCFLLKNPQ